MRLPRTRPQEGGGERLDMVNEERIGILIKMAKVNSSNSGWMVKMAESAGIASVENYRSDQMLWDDIGEVLTELLERRKANEPMPERKSRAKAKGVKGKPTASAKQRKLVKWIAETLKIEMPEEMTYEVCNKFIRANKQTFDKVRLEGRKQTKKVTDEEQEGVEEQFYDPNENPFL